MNRSEYPTLVREPDTIHLDASAAFPLHDSVIATINRALLLGGVPGKGQYDWSLTAESLVESVREKTARFLGVKPIEIHFCYGASDALHRLVESGIADQKSVVYSSKDHASIVELLERSSRPLSSDGTLAYADGQYDLDSFEGTADIVFANHVHHLLGVPNDIPRLKDRFAGASIVLDVSQSIGRMPIDFLTLRVDAAYFSAQKIGGMTGCGVLYISDRYAAEHSIRVMLPNTIPVAAIASLGAAIDLVEASKPWYDLIRTTGKVRSALSAISKVRLIVTTSEYCNGVGIVSFSVDGMSSIEFAQLLAEYGINVRAGNHCITDETMKHDLIRMSWQQYVTDDELDRVIDIMRSILS